jgi:glycosyltransferase involved in cell wall biosynthesis
MNHKILVISEFSDLSTGYAAYCRELLMELSKKYEVAEMARYVSPEDQRVYNKPWKVYPVVPSKKDTKALEQFRSNQKYMFGELIFEKICLDFQPTVVISTSDFWQDNFVDESPFRDKFHWIWMVTADAPNQHEEWLDVYSRCDTVLAYNDWSKDTLINETFQRLDVLSEAPPAVSSDLKPLNKEHIKKTYGLQDKYIIGTVMRNQKRKAFPDLFKSFRLFLDRTERNDILLYCHTSYPDSGWDIPKLLNKYGLSSKTLFSYRCENCGFFFPSFFSDISNFCHRCKQPKAHMCSVKNGLTTKDFAVVYNLMDLFVLYSYLEGFGVPGVEAAACGVPVMEVDFSAMKDVVRKLNGEPLKVIYEYYELETGRDWGMPDNEFFVDKLMEFFNKPSVLMKAEGKRAHDGYIKNYGWDKTIKVWADVFDKIVIQNKWKDPIKYINTNIKAPEKCSNTTFVKTLIHHLIPKYSNTYLELKLIRQLNYGVTTHNPLSNFGDDTSIAGRAQMMPFNREECYKYILNIANKYNYWEQIRSKNV